MNNEEKIEELYQRIFELKEELNKHIKEGIKKDQEIETLYDTLIDFNHRFAKIEGICNEMIKDRYYINEYAIKRYAEEIKDIVFYYIEELKGSDK